MVRFADDAKVTKPQQFADLATVANMFEMQPSLFIAARQSDFGLVSDLA
ncbi:MAG TPA: hypothetical protein VK638_29425 [Edaphobacter sp.]|nr:hypothetical protein [Edaphobacter sp.]